MASDLLSRLIVARETGFLSPDLGDDLLAVVPRLVSRNELLSARDEAIRRAADLIPGSIERKADALRLLILRANGGKNEVMRLAARFGELPNSTRQLRRILTFKPLKCQTNP